MTAVHRAPSGKGLILAEVSLVFVHLAVVVGFGRLYDGNDHFFDLAALTVVAHLLAAGCRRARLPTVVAAVIGLAGAAIVGTWLLLPQTTTLGLPTPTTLDEARAAIDLAAQEFRTVAAPTAPLTGFQILGGLGLWGAVWFADWAAFRLRATAEALAPAVILFTFCTVLGAGDDRFTVAVLFAGSLVLFVANHRAHLAEMDNAWLATAPAEGAMSVRRAALGLGAAAVAIGAVAAPLAPGFDEDAMVTWRNRDRGGGLRTTVSPIVDLRRRLVNQSNREMFEVEANLPSYWRLTSLHEFDGKIWSSGGEYGEAGERLPTSGSVEASTELITQTVRVQSLSAIWVPVAFQARLLGDHSRGLSWDPDSATLIVDADSDDSDGLEYTVTSARPVLDPDVLKRATGVDPADVTERYLPLPGTFPDLAAQEARLAVAGFTNRYEAAKALQDYFQDGSFAYDQEIQAGHGNDALVAFLTERRGYCEQFAGAYAAMARSLGIPARVAVGFTEGERDPLDPSTFQVRGVHAHAWPEVYFPQVGWVPFEPTPGRGIPGAEAYTGITPQQADSAETQPTVSVATTTTTTAPTAPAAPPSTTPTEEVPVRGTILDPAETESSSSWSSILRWVVALAVAWVALLLAAPWLRRMSGRSDDAGEAVLASWRDALEPIRWTTAQHPRSSESHAEFARRTAPLVGDQAGSLLELADLAERAAWSSAPAGADHAARARQLSEQIRADLRTQEPLAARIRRRLSWREAFGRPATRTGRRERRRVQSVFSDPVSSSVDIPR